MRKNSEKLGLLGSVGVLVGCCIGSAIFSISGMTIYYAGPAAILSWIIAGLIQGTYSIEVAELSARYPRSGGVYVFPRKTLGKFYGFIAGWGYVIANFIAVAFSAIYIGRYLSASFPSLAPYSSLFAVGAIVFCAFLNSLKISDAGRFNGALVSVLIITMLVFVITSLTHSNFNPSNFTPFFMGSKGKWGFIEALPNAMLGYGSLVSIAFMVGEVRKPNKNVPLSMVISLVIIMSLYVLMIAGTLGHITSSFLEENEGMRYIPMFAAVWTSMPSALWLAKLISFSAVLALVTTILIVQYLTSLTIRAMSKDGTLPSFLGYSNKNGAPVAGIMCVAIIAALLSLKPSATDLLVNLASLTSAITIIVVLISLLKARKIRPLKEGEYKAPLGNLLSYVIIAIIVISYIPGIKNGSLSMWIFTVITYLIGSLIYFAMQRFSKHDDLELICKVSGEVVHGKGIGRSVGMPTANVDYKEWPKGLTCGVYSSTVNVNGEEFLAVTNVGSRPSIDNDKKILIETHILDFDKDIYGDIVTVNFYKYLRGVQKFEGLEEVKKQVDKDIKYTREIMGNM